VEEPQLHCLGGFYGCLCPITACSPLAGGKLFRDSTGAPPGPGELAARLGRVTCQGQGLPGSLLGFPDLPRGGTLQLAGVHGSKHCTGLRAAPAPAGSQDNGQRRVLGAGTASIASALRGGCVVAGGAASLKAEKV